jgi:hypothetical protein
MLSELRYAHGESRGKGQTVYCFSPSAKRKLEKVMVVSFYIFVIAFEMSIREKGTVMGLITLTFGL